MTEIAPDGSGALQEKFGLETEDIADVVRENGDRIVSLDRLAFICEPCGFRSTEHCELLLESDCERESIDPDEAALDAAIIGDPFGPAFHEFIGQKANELLPEWRTEAAGYRTDCAGELCSEACFGRVALSALRMEIVEDEIDAPGNLPEDF